MPTLTRYQQIVAIAEQGSFRRAAAALHITQPALSKSVQALEAELGARLFDRQSRHLSLTEYGHRVVLHARQLLAAEQDLRHDLDQIAGLSTGRVDVALGPYPSVISGFAAAARLVSEHPLLDITVRVASWRAVTHAVAARQVDLGVAELSEALGNPALLTEVVGRPRAYFFCRAGHPLLQRAPVALADLLQFPWAGTRFPPRVTRSFPGELGRAGRLDEATGDMIPAIELDVPMHLAAFARASDALVVGTLSLVEAALAAGQLVVVPTTAGPIAGEYGFIWLRHRSLSAAALAFMQAVREEERAFVEREARLAAALTPKRAARSGRG